MKVEGFCYTFFKPVSCPDGAESIVEAYWELYSLHKLGWLKSQPY